MTIKKNVFNAQPNAVVTALDDAYENAKFEGFELWTCSEDVILEDGNAVQITVLAGSVRPFKGTRTFKGVYTLEVM